MLKEEQDEVEMGGVSWAGGEDKRIRRKKKKKKKEATYNRLLQLGLKKKPQKKN